jgi:hypothetical protein
MYVTTILPTISLTDQCIIYFIRSRSRFLMPWAIWHFISCWTIISFVWERSGGKVHFCFNSGAAEFMQNDYNLFNMVVGSE